MLLGHKLGLGCEYLLLLENKMLSDQEAIVKQIKVSPGEQVRTNQILLTLASI